MEEKKPTRHQFQEQVLTFDRFFEASIQLCGKTVLFTWVFVTVGDMLW